MLPTAKKLLLLLAIVFFFSCEREEKFTHPVVHTGEVREITSEGAVFYGQVTPGDDVEIIDHGFVWDTHSNPGIGNSYKVSLGPIDGGSFDTKVHSGFEENERYYMRAFAINSNGVVYGRQVTFISKGGLPFELTEFAPKEALFGDTITISGKHLSAKPGDLKIATFNQFNSKVIYASDTKIKVIVPESLDSIESKIRITIFDRTLTFKEPFKLSPPRIVSIIPKKGWNHTTVTIHGEGFHVNELYNKVFIDTIELKVVYSSKQLIRFEPVVEVPHGSHLVKVETLGQQSVSQQYFEKIEPWKRLNTPPLTPSYSHTFGFMIGDRLFAGHRDTREFYEYFPDTDAWTKRKDIPISTEYNMMAFSANDIGYLVIRAQSSHRLYIYSPEDDSWTNLGTFPGQSKSSMNGFTIDNNLYFGLGYRPSTAPGPAQFWIYKYEENAWTRLNDFPFMETSNLRGFNHKNNGYVAGYLRTLGKHGITKYNTSTDSWEFSVDFSDFHVSYVQNIGMSIMSFNESVIFITRKNYTTLEIIEYIPGSNSIESIGEVNISSYYIRFTLFKDNNGYIGITKYNDEINFWNFNNDIPLE